MNSRFPFLLFAAVSLLRAPASAQAVRVPQHAPECVTWAAGELEQTLRDHHLKLNQAVSVSIVAGTPAEITREEQAFTVSRNGKALTIAAGGPVGAMYGLEDVAEQVAHSTARDWPAVLAEIKTGTQRPFLEVRADNPFLHVYPPLLNDREMWRAYIDNLARNRFNLLDLHGAYDLETTSFPNLYPQLVEVPGYPDAGGFTPEYRAKNLASFQALIAYATSRGVRVSFMNYSAVNDRGGIHKGETFLTSVPPEKLAAYTATAVKLLIQQLPGLYMLGFRVGESGQPASFYKQAYLEGVAEANRPDLRLYTRSWQTTKEQLEPIAAAARHGFDIEIKFNGEQLGLPYQAMQGAKYGSYSYQGYLDVPAAYQIIWQIRANGTHRFWAWENTEFIRRTVGACRLGNARGFTLEPHTAYFSVYPRDYFRDAADAATYKYMWQKHWMWYYAWGRLGYDPTLGEDKLIAQFRDHYGRAGEAAYRAMQESGEVVPLAYAYRFVGPDQRDFSPETESGNFDGKVKRARQDLLQYAENHPEDERSFAGIDAWVQERLAGTPDGRYGPFVVASRLESAARSAEDTVKQAPAVDGRAALEWRILRADVVSAAEFGQYHADRIRAMTWLEYGLHTGQRGPFDHGVQGLTESREDWARLSATADAMYKPLSNPLRRQLQFQWAGELPRMTALDATAEQMWTERKPDRPDAGALPLEGAGGGHIEVADVRDVRGDGSVKVSAHVAASAGVKSAVLWWKPLPSELNWQFSPMVVHAQGNVSASFPVDRHGAMYLIEVEDAAGGAKNFPDPFVQTPYRVIAPTQE